MKIITKYDVHEKGWIIENAKAIEAEIYKIEIEDGINYCLKFDENVFFRSESQIFESKQQLIEQL